MEGRRGPVHGGGELPERVRRAPITCRQLVGVSGSRGHDQIGDGLG